MGILAVVLMVGMLAGVVEAADEAAPAAAEKGTCPWRITAIKVGKWGNGKLKDNFFAVGSFPINAGVTERPDWYVNGSYAGKSTMHFNLRALRAAGMLRSKQENTVKIKFVKKPSEFTFTFYYDEDKVRPGQYYTFK
jgi:hypothetical protein